MSKVWNWDDWSGGIAEHDTVDKPGTYHAPLNVITNVDPNKVTVSPDPSSLYSLSGFTDPEILCLFENRSLVRDDKTTDEFWVTYGETNNDSGKGAYKFTNPKWNAVVLNGSAGEKRVIFIGTTDLAKVSYANMVAESWNATVTEPFGDTFTGSTSFGVALRPIYNPDLHYALFGSGELLYSVDGDGTVKLLCDCKVNIVAITKIGDYYRVYGTDRMLMFAAQDIVAKIQGGADPVAPIATVDWKGFSISSVIGDGNQDYVLCWGVYGENISRMYVATGYGRDPLFFQDGQPTEGTILAPAYDARLAISGGKLYVPAYSNAHQVWGVAVFGKQFSFQNPTWSFTGAVSQQINHVMTAADGTVRYAKKKGWAAAVPAVGIFRSMNPLSFYAIASVGKITSRRFYGDVAWKQKALKEVRLAYSIPIGGDVELYVRTDANTSWTKLWTASAESVTGLRTKRIPLGALTSTFSNNWNYVQFQVKMIASATVGYTKVSPEFHGLCMVYDEYLNP